MTDRIRKAAVIGAGTMGGGIAAHIANAGIPVLLLDIVPPGENRRNRLAETALARLRAADPAPFMSPEAARLVTPGNVDDHLDLLSDCDLIIEAVIEDLAIKRDLYRRIDPYRKRGGILASNTSTLPLHALMQDLPESVRQDFMITHFFNPPRYMRLLELVGGPDTRPESLALMADFADRQLGKGVVKVKDTPGFIANRIGIYWLQTALNAAREADLKIEEADALMGRSFGIPKTGVFALLDLIGLDIMPPIDRSMAALLPSGDAYHAQRRDFPLLEKLIADGYTGRKGKGGFYRLLRDGPNRQKQALDLKTGQYRPAETVMLDALKAAKSNPAILMAYPDRYGQYARTVMTLTLGYAAALADDIAYDIADIDRAMRLGYNWRYGPFELIDRIGVNIFLQHLKQEGITPPPLIDSAARLNGFYRVDNGQIRSLQPADLYRPVARPEGVLALADIKRAGAPLIHNGSASLWDLGDGVTCLEFHSKMNAIDPDSLSLIRQSLDLTGKRFQAMVIYNDGENFSVGANIGLALYAANLALWPMIDDMVSTGQNVYRALKYAPFPVVGAPAGLALGGGCEVLLHCGAIQAHAETYMGLVEAGVGLIPAWGGCKELLQRGPAPRPGSAGARGPMPPILNAFETIATARVSRSAADAKAIGYLRASDGITMNRDWLLIDAKTRALHMVAEKYQPAAPPVFHLPGATARAALRQGAEQFHAQGKASDYDLTIAGVLAQVLSGGETDLILSLSEEDMLKLERQAFGQLIRQPATLARMEHMLATGKALRN